MRYLKRNKVLGLLLTFLMIGTISACGGSEVTAETTDSTEAVQPIYELTREDSRTAPREYTAVNLSDVREELLITDAGDYMLTGTLSGYIHVKAEEQVVHLFLNNVNVKSTTTPAVYVESAGKVILTACGGTENGFSDGSKYVEEDYDACIYSRNDLTINGSGKITVSGYYKDAIHTKDHLKIADVALSVQSKDDGLHGNDGVMIKGADISVQSEGSGIRTTKTGKELKGNIEISGSHISIIAGEHAITSSRNIYIVSSRAFIKGILSNCNAAGETYIEEGSLTNE